MTTSIHLTRRSILAVSTAALAASVFPAFSQSTLKGAVIMQDPTTKYPKAAIQKQSQPFPGLAGKMTRSLITARPPTRDRVALQAARL
jgi:hypothetical protein